MELVNTDAPSHDIAKCLSSVKVAVAANCAITITATAAGGNFVPAMWQPVDASLTYAQYAECPEVGTAVAPGAVTTAARLNAIQTAFGNHIYGSGKAYTTTLDYAAGKVTATADTKTFTYVITEMTLAAVATDLNKFADIKVITSTAGLPAAAYKASITTACGAGRYGLIVSDKKLW